MSLLSGRQSDRKEMQKKELLKPRNHPNTEILLSKDFPPLGSPSKFRKRKIRISIQNQNSQKSKFYKPKQVSKSVNIKTKLGSYKNTLKRDFRHRKFARSQKLQLRSRSKSKIKPKGYRDSSVPFMKGINAESQVIHSQVLKRTRFKSMQIKCLC